MTPLSLYVTFNDNCIELRYQTEFGFVMPNRKILVNDIRVRGIGKIDIQEDPRLPFSNVSPKVEKVSRRKTTPN